MFLLIIFIKIFKKWLRCPKAKPKPYVFEGINPFPVLIEGDANLLSAHRTQKV